MRPGLVRGILNLSPFFRSRTSWLGLQHSSSRVLLVYAQFAHFCRVFGTYGSTDIIPWYGTTVRGQSPSSMGESFFFPCTRHVSMYLHHGIVILSFILSFILSLGALFLLMSPGIPRTVHKCGRLALCIMSIHIIYYSNFKKRFHLPGVVRTWFYMTTMERLRVCYCP